jgi:hypothetical protein
MKRIYISEAAAESKEEFVFLEYLYNMKDFLKSLLTKPLTCDVNDFFKEMGYTKQDLVKILLDRGVIVKDTSIDTVCESNTIDEVTGCAGVMGGGMPGDVDGNYEKKLEKTGMQKKIFVNEQQFRMLMEMGTADAGNYQYDVPLEFNGGNDPAYDHSNIIRRSFGNTRKKKVKK